MTSGVEIAAKRAISPGMKHLLIIAALAVSACASNSGQSEGYGAPSWGRSFCETIIWEQQGAEDGKRYKDGEKRLQALDEVCGKHLVIPRQEYLAAFSAAKG